MTRDEAYNPTYVHWFGDPWPSERLRAPICEDDRYRVDTPVGSRCISCGELIDVADRGIRYSDGASYAHAECNLRSVLGCYNSLVGQGHDHDRPYREDAQLVWKWMQAGGLRRGLNDR